MFVKSGIPSSGFNVVFALEHPDSLSDISQQVTRQFVNTKIPWELITTPEISDSLQALIEEFDMVRASVEPGMLLPSLEDRTIPSIEGFKIKQVSGPEQIETFLKVGIMGFGDPTGSLLLPLARGLFRRRSSYLPAFYLGYLNGIPVATSLRFSSEKIGGIFYVATLPEYRRKGFGKAMTLRAALDGKMDDCTASYLQASEMGRPIYEKIGYVKICDYEIWRSKEFIEDLENSPG